MRKPIVKSRTVAEAGIVLVAGLSAFAVAHASLLMPPAKTPAREARLTKAVPSAVTQPAQDAVLIAFEEPVPGHAVVSPFGLRQLPWEGNGRLHEGVDISADLGVPVVAVADAKADGAIVVARRKTTDAQDLAEAEKNLKGQVRDAAKQEKIDGLRSLSIGPDGRPRAQLAL